MGSDLTATCSQPQINKPSKVTIQVVSNGFVIDGYGVQTKIANTLAEALELARKELV
jgi:hypothetical protein